MEIVFIIIGVFIFFMGFLAGGGWQLKRSQKEIEELRQARNMKSEDIPTVSYTEARGLVVHKHSSI